MGAGTRWRMRRQYLDMPVGAGPVEVARRVAGVWGDDGVTLWEDIPAPLVDAELSRHGALKVLLA